MRNIPDDNLAMPVLISFIAGSSGSGFLLEYNKKLYLITAKHVLYTETGEIRGTKVNLLFQSKDIDDETTGKYIIDLSTITKFIHPNSDVAGIELGTIEENGIQFNNNVEISEESQSGFIFISSESIKMLENVLISNDVFLYGYPSSLGIKSSPQFDYSKPLLRKGIIANIYKSYGTIILDCPVYYGNSGGPVIEVETDGGIIHHKIIGVVSQFIPFLENWVNQNTQVIERSEMRNSGYSVAVSMDKVIEMIS